MTEGIWRDYSHSTVRRSCLLALACLLALILNAPLFSQTTYDDHRIDNIQINFGPTETAPAAAAEPYLVIIREAIGPTYNYTRIRDSIQALYNTQRIASVTVSADLNSANGVDLKYVVNRKPLAEKVSIVIGKTPGTTITEQELMFRLDLLAPGTVYTIQTLDADSDQILDYMRSKGFFRSEVKYTQTPLALPNAANVVFNVTPNEQARVSTFDVKIDGLDPPLPAKILSLSTGVFYTRDQLTKDVDKVKEYLRSKDFAAPELDEPHVTYDSGANTIAIELTGKVGPKVKVLVDSGKDKIGDGTLTKLLPVKRDGTLDYAAIVEGERRLENYFQEQGYFFADVTPFCSVDPPLNAGTVDAIPNDTEFLCSALGSSELMNKTVTVDYRVDKSRKLKLVSVRIHGTDLLPIDEIRTVLETQQANALGVIPLFGYGRGFTSASILDRDAATVRSLMNELGYRDAQVHVNQGVSPNGEDLIITFEVEQGPPTVVSSVDIEGNKAFDSNVLLAQTPVLTSGNFSRAKMRNAVQKLQKYYSDAGYFDAHVTASLVEETQAAPGAAREVKIVFKVENEGKKVVVNRVLVTGNEAAKEKSILNAAQIRPGDLLRSTDIYLAEQNLYSTDAFDRVEIKPEPAGNRPDGSRASDVIINVNEQPPRLLTYGGGYSTDVGLSGFFDIRHVDLLGKLWQGEASVRWSQRQQLVEFDFVDPRFLRDGEKHFTPLTISLQYQQDSTVTRFFRSAFDKGTYGIVQRVDQNGDPIDEFGNAAHDPTINRTSLSIETSRTLSRKNRSIIFARYRFEDVRLANVDSLLIKDLLLPDSRVRISGPSATFVRDTRENCSTKYSLLELIARGEPADRCKYNASDPTQGDYLTLEYNLSVRQLGANISFHKFQASYNYYYTFPHLHNTTLAARAVLGLASVFSEDSRFNNPQFPDLNGILPISERFFAGGSTTIRGFGFEEAGPRVVIVPQGIFRNSKGDPAFLPPFTIPFGGNALAVLNLEARIPVSKSVRIVPFYDGGNVFRRIGEILNPADVPANDEFRQNLRAVWTHTIGLGFRIKTPIGGEFAIDYGHLLDPPRFLIPQTVGPDATYQLRQSQLHFRFSQAF